MYDPYIMKRTQIYLDDGQADELARRAKVRGTTTSKMIRDAIDEYLAEPRRCRDPAEPVSASPRSVVRNRAVPARWRDLRR